MRPSPRAQRLLFSLPPYDTLHTSPRNNPEFHVDRTYARCGRSVNLLGRTDGRTSTLIYRLSICKCNSEKQHCIIILNFPHCSEGKEWKEVRSTLNPAFTFRKLGRYVKKLNPVNDTFIRVAQGGADAEGYSKDVMDLLPYWSMEGMYQRVR